MKKTKSNVKAIGPCITFRRSVLILIIYHGLPCVDRVFGINLLTRSCISRAALFVNVTPRIFPGVTPFSIMCAIRKVMTRVFPVPTPAKIKTGPSMVSTARRCCGLSVERFNMRIGERSCGRTQLRIDPVRRSRNSMNAWIKRRGRKGSRRGAQRNFLCVLCENLRALCVKISPSPNQRGNLCRKCAILRHCSRGAESGFPPLESRLRLTNQGALLTRTKTRSALPLSGFICGFPCSSSA